MRQLSTFLYPRPPYRVVGQLIVVKNPNAEGGEQYLKRGQRVPAGVQPYELDRLEALGMIAPMTADVHRLPDAAEADDLDDDLDDVSDEPGPSYPVKGAHRA